VERNGTGDKDMEKYKIVFCGELKTGHDLLSVKARLASLFKVSGVVIDKLFLEKPVLVRTNLSFNEAQGFKMNFDATGALCQMLEVSEKPRIHGANVPAASEETPPMNQSTALSSPPAQEVSRPSSFSSSTKDSDREFTYRQPFLPQKKNRAVLIIVFIVIIIFFGVILKKEPKKNNPGPSTRLPATPRSAPQVAPRSSSASRVLSQNTTIFNDYKGYYTVSIPEGFRVTNKSSRNRSKVLLEYSPDVNITIIASPMNKPWNPQSEMMNKITALYDGRAGSLSRLDLKSYGLINFNGLDGYEMILQKGRELAHAYALVSSTHTAFSIAVVTKGNNYQENHDILDSAVRKSFRFN
jgi:hypothetical protein